MKTKFAIAAIALALTSSVAFAESVEVGKGKITASGNIKSSSCVISAGTSGSNTVTLKDVYATDLVDGAVSNTKDFTIEVSGCSVVSTESNNLTVTLDAVDLADSAKGYLKNESNGGAENVFIAVLDKNSDGDDNGTVFIPGKQGYTATKKAAADSTNKVVFNYAAGYATDDKSVVKAGPVSGIISYVVSYN